MYASCSTSSRARRSNSPAIAHGVRTPGPAGTWVDEIESLHDDYLGSTHVVTDESGAVVRTGGYDPWGQARAAESWLAPLDGQAYNRYAYVRNGPLSATDPSGYGEQGLGSDDGDAGKGAPLGPDCSDPRGCVRPIFVLDADGNTSSALESWNRSLQLFDSPNGGGQGGPDFGRGGHGSNPYSPNGVRHGNDSGQPGRSPGFMLGRARKTRPVGHLGSPPIDAWAATAADIAADSSGLSRFSQSSIVHPTLELAHHDPPILRPHPRARRTHRPLHEWVPG